MWIILEGLDRTGKSSVADYYRQQGYEVVHMSAPDKKYSQSGYTGPSYTCNIWVKALYLTDQYTVN